MLQAPGGKECLKGRAARELRAELSLTVTTLRVGAVRSLQPGRHPGHATAPCFAEKDGHVGSTLV